MNKQNFGYIDIFWYLYTQKLLFISFFSEKMGILSKKQMYIPKSYVRKNASLVPIAHIVDWL